MSLKKALVNYMTWLQEKKSKFYIHNIDRENDLLGFYHGKNCPNDAVLNAFFKWVKANKQIIDTLVMWGSYTKGLESEQSYNRFKSHGERTNFLSVGPSDIDALVIAKGPLSPPPPVLKHYLILDTSLRQTSKVDLDVFRDIIIISADKAKSSILGRSRPEYVDSIIYAYFHGGIVLVTSKRTRALFEELKKERPLYCRNSEKYFGEKLEWFDQFKQRN